MISILFQVVGGKVDRGWITRAWKALQSLNESQRLLFQLPGEVLV